MEKIFMTEKLAKLYIADLTTVIKYVQSRYADSDCTGKICDGNGGLVALRNHLKYELKASKKAR